MSAKAVSYGLSIGNIAPATFLIMKLRESIVKVELS